MLPKKTKTIFFSACTFISIKTNLSYVNNYVRINGEIKKETVALKTA